MKNHPTGEPSRPLLSSSAVAVAHAPYAAIAVWATSGVRGEPVLLHGALAPVYAHAARAAWTRAGIGRVATLGARVGDEAPNVLLAHVSCLPGRCLDAL